MYCLALSWTQGVPVVVSCFFCIYIQIRWSLAELSVCRSPQVINLILFRQ